MKQRFTPGAMWNFERCHAVRGTVIVGESKAPAAWSKPFVGQRRKVLKVTCKDAVFYLDNEHGEAERKVFEEGGGPQSSSRDTACDETTFMPDE